MGEIKSLEAYRRRAAGAKAQAFGSVFEEMFHAMCRNNGITVTRFPDGCRVIGPSKVIRVKTPFDWVLTYNGRTALIDTKTSNSHSFPHSKITPHQVQGMLQHEKTGAVAGYVIWLRESNDIIFVSSSNLMKLAKIKGSIGKEDTHSKRIGDASYFDVKLLFPPSLSTPPPLGPNHAA